MPKVKTHKGLLKRVRITGKGKVKHKRAGTGHLMSHKSGTKCQELAGHLTVSKPIAKKLQSLLHMRLIGREQG